MTKRMPIENKTDAHLPFFFSVYNVILIFVRPHEMSTMTNTLSFIKFFAITSLIATLLTLNH